jgi:hypothetical protein
LLPPNSPTRRRQNGDSKKKVQRNSVERRDDPAQARVALALDWHAPYHRAEAGSPPHHGAQARSTAQAGSTSQARRTQAGGTALVRHSQAGSTPQAGCTSAQHLGPYRRPGDDST